MNCQLSIFVLFIRILWPGLFILTAAVGSIPKPWKLFKMADFFQSLFLFLQNSVFKVFSSLVYNKKCDRLIQRFHCGMLPFCAIFVCHIFALFLLSLSRTNFCLSILPWLVLKHSELKSWTCWKISRNWHRPHITVKNARNLKSDSEAKPPYFEGIFKLWTHEHEQQDLPFLQMFIGFAQQNLKMFCVKRSWSGFRVSWTFWCCMRSI